MYSDLDCQISTPVITAEDIDRLVGTIDNAG
jgi:hypothetical protein